MRLISPFVVLDVSSIALSNKNISAFRTSLKWSYRSQTSHKRERYPFVDSSFWQWYLLLIFSTNEMCDRVPPYMSYGAHYTSNNQLQHVWVNSSWTMMSRIAYKKQRLCWWITLQFDSMWRTRAFSSMGESNVYTQENN